MDNQKYQIIASLEAGESPDIIARRLDLSKAQVLRVKVEYDRAIVEGTLDNLVNVDELVLINAARASQEQMPTLDGAINEVANQMQDGIDRLRKLDDQMMATAVFATTRIRSGLATATGSGEVVDFVACLCRLREAFFNKNVTQVNIQNNLSNSGQAAYGDWLNDKPN